MATASVTKHTVFRLSLELTEAERKLLSLTLQNVKHDNGTPSMRICRTVFEALNSPVVEE